MEIMFDSTTAQDIPVAPGSVVGGYVDGAYAWSEEDWARFPGQVHIGITTHPGSVIGDECDYENGDFETHQQVAEWIKTRSIAEPGRSWSVYVDRSTWPILVSALKEDGITNVVYRVADWTGNPHGLPGAWAVQYADPERIHGNPHYDLSVVSDTSWMVAGSVEPPAPPVEPPEPTPPPVEPEMSQGATGPAVRILQLRLGVSVDGDFGPATTAAVCCFQQARHLSVDGIVGPETWHALDSLRLDTPTFPGEIQYGTGVVGEPSMAVHDWQIALTSAGFGPLTVDGRCGALTEAVIKRAQEASHITVDGIGGPVTWYAIH